MTKSLTFLLVAFQIFSTTFISCKNKESTSTTTSTTTTTISPSLSTIADIVNSDTNFSLLKQAVARAGIGNALSTGTLTVFAPDNSAFIAAGISAASINALSVDNLSNILTYHILARNVASIGVPASDTLKTLQGNNLFASKNNNGIFINGIKIKNADVQASNGVIHVISKVMTPPTKNIAELTNATANLSLLYAAVAKVGLAGVLTSAGKYTLFAPTNAAFILAGFPNINAINKADTSVLAPIVRAHILKTNLFASDFISGELSPATLQNGVSLKIGLNPSSLKINTSFKPASNIVTPNGVDIIGTNGVIHLIDRVLL